MDDLRTLDLRVVRAVWGRGEAKQQYKTALQQIPDPCHTDKKRQHNRIRRPAGGAAGPKIGRVGRREAAGRAKAGYQTGGRPSKRVSVDSLL